MKKKTLFLSLVASALFVTSLASCDELNNNKNTTTTVVEPTTSEPTTKPSEPTQTVQYNLEDNEVSQKVFNEYKKEYPDASYNDFLLNGNKFQNSNNTVSYFYKARIDITLDSANNFVSKAFFIKDNNDKTVAYKYSDYVNNEWIETKNGLYFNEQLKFTSYITLSDGTFNRKFEYTYDEDGNMTTESASKYVNNEWIKVEEYGYINNERKLTCSIGLNRDGSFSSKQEYTYDANGNKLTEKISHYKNNEWVKEIEAVYINNERKLTYYEGLNNSSINVKEETTYDANGNRLTFKESQYINNEWVKTKETKTFNGVEKELYLLTFNDNGTIATKEETTYDENGKSLNKKVYKYINNDWVLRKESTFINDVELDVLSYTFRGDSYKYKNEYAYDANGNNLSTIRSEYLNGDWQYINKNIYTYDENGNRLTTASSLHNGTDWELKTEQESTYDANGKLAAAIVIQYQDGEYSTKSEITYDINGKTLSQISSKRENDTWVYDSKEDNTYDNDGNIITSVRSKYVNNDWVKTIENKLFGDFPLKTVYSLIINDDGTFGNKTEWTYDENGKELTLTQSKFINNEWVKIYATIGDNHKITYGISFNQDNTFNTKAEYTYDENGKELTSTQSKYINNEWVKINEYKYFGNEIKTTYSLSLNDDNTFKELKEYTYDDNGNKLIITETTYDTDGNKKTRETSVLMKGIWQLVHIVKYINNEPKESLIITTDGDTINTKAEYTYDSNGNLTCKIDSIFENNDWVLSTKIEYTYDSDGNLSSTAYYEFKDGGWVLKA